MQQVARIGSRHGIPRQTSRGAHVAPRRHRVHASASPLVGSACQCPEHVEDLQDLRIPVCAEMREDDFEVWSVAELMEVGRAGSPPHHP